MGESLYYIVPTDTISGHTIAMQKEDSTSLICSISVRDGRSNPISSSTVNNSKKLDSPFREDLKKVKQKNREKLVSRLSKELSQELKYFVPDEINMSGAERKMLYIEEHYSLDILGDVVQSIYLEYNDYPEVLVGICDALKKFELEEVKPWGPTMLMGLLNHKNETVKEYALNVVENWADISLLPVLRNLDCTSGWLRSYVNDIVSELEEMKNVH